MRVRLAWVALLALLSMVAWGSTASAQNTNANQTFTLVPGGKATIDFQSFCIDYGKKFPEQVGLPPTNVADPTVVGALNNALAKGYTGSSAREVQLAIWKARGATDAPQPGNVGNEIAQNLQQPAAPQGATSVIDALKNNQIKMTAGSWQGIGEKLKIGATDDFYQGQGQIQVENTSSQELTLYMPVGTVFPAPSAEFQSMAGYATNVSVNNPAPTQAAQQAQTLPDTGLTDKLLDSPWLLIAYAIVVVLSGLFIRRYYARA
ncbi:MAG TPA: hypothetical protein VFZ66_16130 [Herpetosiphonaceae bacterium]